MASEQAQDGGPASIKADEPKPTGAPSVEKEPQATDPRAAGDRANAIDETTAGDGVTFFEGGDGRESARGDIERNG